MSHEKNPPSNFPLNPGWLIGILMSWFIIIPIKLGRMSSPIYPKQPGFSHCSHVLPPKQHWKNPTIGDFLELFWSRTSRCENWQTSTVFHLGCNFKLPKTRPVSQGGIWGVLACCKILWVVASLSCKILLHPPPKVQEFTPEIWWFEDDPFLLAWSNFKGPKSETSGGVYCQNVWVAKSAIWVLTLNEELWDFLVSSASHRTGRSYLSPRTPSASPSTSWRWVC